MKDFGKVSLIIPVYNAEDYIDECLDSLVNQTYKNLEIICINDGSSDSSVKHIEEYMKNYQNIVLINQENAGVVGARNVGIKNATGKYIMFVDSDDYIDLTMVEKMVGELNRTKADAAKCNIDTTLAFLQHSKIENNKFYSSDEYQDIIKQLFEDNNIFCTVCNGIYKKELCWVFPEGFRYGEDVLFNGEYFLKAKSIVLLKDALYHYRNNPTSVTHKPSIDSTIDNLEHFCSYNHVGKLVENMDNKELKEDILKKVACRNYATYMRLIFRIFRIESARNSIKYAKKYYKLYKDVFNKVKYEDIKNLVVDNYHWQDIKVKTCVNPFYKKHFLMAYIGFKRLKKKN